MKLVALKGYGTAGYIATLDIEDYSDVVLLLKFLRYNTHTVASDAMVKREM